MLLIRTNLSQIRLQLPTVRGAIKVNQLWLTFFVLNFSTFEDDKFGMGLFKFCFLCRFVY
jgi:hypothetical protein